MNSSDAATRQDLVVNSVEHRVSSLANSASSPEELEILFTSELDRDLITWPRQYLETYLDSDSTGRVPLDTEQLQDVLEAAFDRDAALAREYLEELSTEHGPKSLGESTLEIAIARSDGKETEYELLFDPAHSQDLKYLIEKLGMRAWGKQNAQPTPEFERQLDIERRETTTSVAVHQPGSGAIELHHKTTGTDDRKLLGGGDLPPDLQSALKQMARHARIEHAQIDSGTYRGRIIGETGKSLIQQITSHRTVVHRKDLLDMIPAVGESVRVAYTNESGRVLPIKERSKSQELGR